MAAPADDGGYLPAAARVRHDVTLIDAPGLGVVLPLPGGWLVQLGETGTLSAWPQRCDDSYWMGKELAVDFWRKPLTGRFAEYVVAHMDRQVQGTPEHALLSLGGRSVIRYQWTNGVRDCFTWFVEAPDHRHVILADGICGPGPAEALLVPVEAMLSGLRFRACSLRVRRGKATCTAKEIAYRVVEELGWLLPRGVSWAETVLAGSEAVLHDLTMPQARLMAYHLAELGLEVDLVDSEASG